MKKPIVLVVDDESIVRSILCEVLTQEEYTVFEAEDGATALDILGREKIDMVLLDIGLPDINGIDLLQQIKAEYPEIVAILITGEVGISSAVAAFEFGAARYFVKPIHPGEMLIRLSSVWEKHLLEMKIKALNEIPRKILDSVNVAICIINVKDFTLESVNNYFLKEVALPEDKVLGKTCHEIIHRLMAPCSGLDDLCPLHESVLTGEDAFAEHRHYDADNVIHYVEVTATPLKDAHGKVVQIVHTSRDITDRKNLEISLVQEQEKLQKANEELSAANDDLKLTQSRVIHQEKMASIGQLAAGVAHEINNPVGFVTSNLASLKKYFTKLADYTKILEDSLALSADPEELARVQQEKKALKINYVLDDVPELVEESLDGTERVKKIVQNLKCFSRVDDQNQSEADINECLESTLNIVWNELKYNSQVTKDYGDIPRVVCFPNQLNQVFMNLLVNAGHSITEKGDIRIKSYFENGFVVVTISDNGCGIPPEIAHRIFEPFFTTKEAGKGTGLGMSIAYDIIKKHKGELSFTSEVDKGSVFTVKLPVT